MATSKDERIRVLDRLHKRLRETMPGKLTPEGLKVLEEESTVLAELLDEMMGIRPLSETTASYDAWVKGLFCEEAPEPVSLVTGLTDTEYFQRNLAAIRARPHIHTEPPDTREEADLPWGAQS